MENNGQSTPTEPDPNDTFEITNQELKDFLEALTQSVVRSNMEAMDAVFRNVLPPFMERVEGIAAGQITLAKALQTSRRDNCALTFAKLLIDRALSTAEGIDTVAIHTIPSMAYALADEMELHGRVAEVQAEAKQEQREKFLAEAEHASPDVLVSRFLNRIPKTDPKPAAKGPIKKGAAKGKH